MTAEKASLADQRRSTPQGRMGMAAAKLALEASNLLSSAFSARKDIDQKGLAERIGVSEGRVSQVLHGDGNVHIATLARYMAAMGYDLELVAKPAESSAPELVAADRRRRRSGKMVEKQSGFPRFFVRSLFARGWESANFEAAAQRVNVCYLLPTRGITIGDARISTDATEFDTVIIKMMGGSTRAEHSKASDQVQDRVKELAKHL